MKVFDDAIVRSSCPFYDPRFFFFLFFFVRHLEGQMIFFWCGIPCCGRWWYSYVLALVKDACTNLE